MRPIASSLRDTGPSVSLLRDTGPSPSSLRDEGTKTSSPHDTGPPASSLYDEVPTAPSPTLGEPVLDPMMDPAATIGASPSSRDSVALGTRHRAKLVTPRRRLGEPDDGRDEISDDLVDLEEERRTSGDEDLMARNGGNRLSFPLNDEDPGLPAGGADAALSSDSSSTFRSLPSELGDGDGESRAEADQPAVTKKKKARPDPPGSTLSDEESLQLLRERCEISDEITLTVPHCTQRADAPPPGHFTLYENFVEHCLLWFPVPGFLLRFLEANNISLAQINPRGLRHIIGIYVLSRECNAEISTEQLSCLLDCRPRGRAEELRYMVSPVQGRTLIDGFPSKDDHFEDRFFFVEISEKTVEADCIPLVRTGWEKRVKPVFRTISRSDAAAIHSVLVSESSDWVKTFTRQRIQKALSTRIFPGKVLGRGAPRVSALQRAEKAKESSATNVVPAKPRSQTQTPSTSVPKTPAATVQRSHAHALTPDEVVKRREQIRKRAQRSTPDAAPPKRQRIDSSPTAVPSSLALGSSRGTLALAKANVSELSAQLDQLAFCYEEDSRSRELELSEAKRANTELAERNRALEDEVASAHKGEEELSGKLSRASLRHAKDKEEIALLRGKLLDAEALGEAKIEEAVAKAKDEVARDSASRTRQVAKLLDRIGGTAKDNMLDLAEIDASLEFIERLRKPDGPTLDSAEPLLVERKIPIYDARDVFCELVSDVRQALGIPEDDDVIDEDEGVHE